METEEEDYNLPFDLSFRDNPLNQRTKKKSMESAKKQLMVSDKLA
jgi:hypothetical protein